MNKLLLLLSLLPLPYAASAQTLNLHLSDGTSVSYSPADLDSVIFSGSAEADGKVYGATVNATNGDTDTFLFSSTPVLTYDGGLVTIHVDSIETEYPVEKISGITFSLTTDISGIKVSDHLHLNGYRLVLSGLTPQTEIKLLDTGGSEVIRTRAASDGSASISLQELPKGIYIVYTGGRSYKIYRQ